MIRPEMSKWEQTLADLRRLSVEAEHPRTRERFMALYLIGSGQTNATQWADEIGRDDNTVLKWVHMYNVKGPESLLYRHTGGRSPLLTPDQVKQIVATVKESVPIEHNLPGYNWTVKKVRRWVKAVLGCEVGRRTLSKLLQIHDLSWKKCQKVLKRAKPAKRAEFVADFRAAYAQMCQGTVRLIYIDEAHFHRDMDLGYTWAEKGKPAWRLSDCPRLQDRIDWYGAYDFTNGRCFIWNEGVCNGDNTIKFLEHLAAWLGPAPEPTIIIWDGAPCHKAKVVQTAATTLGFTILPLPAYSPDLNPIEGLWKWMREEVTQNHCYATMRQLFDACKAFIDRINADPLAIIKRLWPKFELNPEFEKLLLSM